VLAMLKLASFLCSGNNGVISSTLLFDKDRLNNVYFTLVDK